MELLWRFFSIFVGLHLLELCNCLPLNLQTAAQGLMQWEWSASMLTLMVAACIVIIIAGCVCCHHRKGFQEFTDASINVSAGNLVNNDLEQGSSDPGHVNPIAMAAILEPNSEFTIFRPLSPLHYNNNIFAAQPMSMQTISEVHPDSATKIINDLLAEDDLNDWFDNSHIHFPRSKLKYIREIGRGWFGRVIEGEVQHILQNQQIQPVIVRVLDATASHQEQVAFLHELKHYKNLSHPNILKLYGGCLEASPLLIIQEHCSKGDLKMFLKENCNELKQQNNVHLLQMSFELTDALLYLHQNKIIHPDLATRNCQVSTDMSLRLGDYGIAVQKYPQDYYPGAPHVPVRWCAPEIISFTDTTIQPKQMSYSANVWSLGVTIWELISFGMQPYKNLSDDEVVTQVLGPPHTPLQEPIISLPFTHNLYLLSQLCCSASELRPEVSQVHSMLVHLLHSYTSKPESAESLSDSDFQTRWNSFKPNSIVKTDNHRTTASEPLHDISETTFTIVKNDSALNIKIDSIETTVPDFKSDKFSLTTVHYDPNLSPSTESTVNSECYVDMRNKSASLTNLHGSFENLTDTDVMIEKINKDYDSDMNTDSHRNESSYNTNTLDVCGNCDQTTDCTNATSSCLANNIYIPKEVKNISDDTQDISDFNLCMPISLKNNHDENIKETISIDPDIPVLKPTEKYLINPVSESLEEKTPKNCVDGAEIINALQKDEEYESWLLNVASEYPSDLQYIKGLSQALKDLDSALAQEKTSSSSCTDSSHRPSPGPDSLASDSKSTTSSNRSSKLVDVCEQVEVIPSVSNIETHIVPEKLSQSCITENNLEKNTNLTVEFEKEHMETSSPHEKDALNMSFQRPEINLEFKENVELNIDGSKILLKVDFQLGPISSFPSDSLTINRTSTPGPESIFDSILFHHSNSGSETEDETWRKRIERGVYSEKVRQKSKSVTDLMILTHIETDTDSETPLQSLDYKNNYLRCTARNNHENFNKSFGSEGNLDIVHDTFQEELRKLQEARRDSLLFVPVSLQSNSTECLSISDCEKYGSDKNSCITVHKNNQTPNKPTITDLDVVESNIKGGFLKNEISNIFLANDNIEVEINYKRIDVCEDSNLEIVNNIGGVQTDFENKENIFLNGDNSSTIIMLNVLTTNQVENNGLCSDNIEVNNDTVSNFDENNCNHYLVSSVENNTDIEPNVDMVFHLEKDIESKGENIKTSCENEHKSIEVNNEFKPGENNSISQNINNQTIDNICLEFCNNSSNLNLPLITNTSLSDNHLPISDSVTDLNLNEEKLTLDENTLFQKQFKSSEKETFDINNLEYTHENKCTEIFFLTNNKQHECKDKVSEIFLNEKENVSDKSFKDAFLNVDLDKENIAPSNDAINYLISQEMLSVSLNNIKPEFSNNTFINKVICDNPVRNQKIQQSSSVILGPCDEYTLDLYSGLKTTCGESSEEEMIGSNFLNLNEEILKQNKNFEKVSNVPVLRKNIYLTNLHSYEPIKEIINPIQNENKKLSERDFLFSKFCDNTQNSECINLDHFTTKNTSASILTVKNLKDECFENGNLTPDSLELEQNFTNNADINLYANELVNEIVTKAENFVANKSKCDLNLSKDFKRNQMIIAVKEIIESIIGDSIKKIEEEIQVQNCFHSDIDQQTTSNQTENCLNESIFESMHSDVVSTSQLDSLEYSINCEHHTFNNNSVSDNTDMPTDQTVIRQELNQVILINDTSTIELKPEDDLEICQQYDIDKDSIPSTSEIADSSSSKIIDRYVNHNDINNLNKTHTNDNSSPVQDLNQTYDIDDKTFICESQMIDLNDVEINLDDGFEEKSHILDSTYGVVTDNIDHDGFSLEGGWFLHPQGSGVASSSEDPDSPPASDNSYVGFSLDEECVAALRNELAAKLPHARGPMVENDQEEWDSEPASSEQHDEIVLRYNIYATPLSPIPEESEEYECLTPDITHCRDDSDSDYDWSAEGACDTDSRTPRASSPGIGVGGCRSSRRHTPSLDSCCSNDTLFNIEDINGSTIIALPFEHETALLKTIEGEDKTSTKDEPTNQEVTSIQFDKNIKDNELIKLNESHKLMLDIEVINSDKTNDNFNNINKPHNKHTNSKNSEYNASKNSIECNKELIIKDEHNISLQSDVIYDTCLISKNIEKETNIHKTLDSINVKSSHHQNVLPITIVDNLSCTSQCSENEPIKSFILEDQFQKSINTIAQVQNDLFDIKNTQNCIDGLIDCNTLQTELNYKIINRIDDLTNHDTAILNLEKNHSINQMSKNIELNKSTVEDQCPDGSDHESNNINENINFETDVHLHESQLTDTENNTNTLHSDCPSSTEKLDAEPSTQEIITDGLNCSKSDEMLFSEHSFHDTNLNVENKLSPENCNSQKIQNEIECNKIHKNENKSGQLIEDVNFVENNLHDNYDIKIMSKKLKDCDYMPNQKISLENVTLNNQKYKGLDSPEGSYTMSDILSCLDEDTPIVEKEPFAFEIKSNYNKTLLCSERDISADESINLNIEKNIMNIKTEEIHENENESTNLADHHEIILPAEDKSIIEDLNLKQGCNETQSDQNTSIIKTTESFLSYEKLFNSKDILRPIINNQKIYLTLEKQNVKECCDKNNTSLAICTDLNVMDVELNVHEINDNVNSASINDKHNNTLNLVYKENLNPEIIRSNETPITNFLIDIKSTSNLNENFSVVQTESDNINILPDLKSNNFEFENPLKEQANSTISVKEKITKTHVEQFSNEQINNADLNQVINLIEKPKIKENEIKSTDIVNAGDFCIDQDNIEYETSTSFSDDDHFDEFKKIDDSANLLYENLENFDDITARKFYENIPTSPVLDDVIESIYENIGNVSKFDSLNYLQRKRNKDNGKKLLDQTDEDNTYEKKYVKAKKISIGKSLKNNDICKNYHIYDSVADDSKSDNASKCVKLEQNSSLEDSSTITESLYDNVISEHKLDYANFCIDLTTADYSDGSLKDDEDHTYDKVCTSDDLYSDLTDIRFSGPCDAQLMSTSFSDAHMGSDEQEWDSSSDSRSSSSGEFVWKEGEHESSVRVLHAPSEEICLNPMDELSRMDVITEEDSSSSSSSSSSSNSGDDDEGLEFVPSAWDSQATPTKSALRSPDKKRDESEQKKRGVWFKKQKYHCVYEYPREPDMSPPEWIRSSDSTLWGTPSASDLSHFADWDLETDTLTENVAVESQTDESAEKDLDDDNSAAVLSRYTRRDYFRRADDLYRLADVATDIEFTTGSSMTDDDDFYISSSARPFQTYSLSSQFFPGQFQFVPETTNNKTCNSLKIDRANSIINFANDLKKLHENLYDKSYNTLSQGLITPDSGVEDITPASIPDNVEFSNAQIVLENKKMLLKVESLKILAENVLKEMQRKLDEKIKFKAIDVLGGLRHTRNRLKLDLPPSPSSFSASKSFDLDISTDLTTADDLNTKISCNQDMPTFTTFGKTRFSIKHVETPTEEIDVFKVPFVPKIVPVIAEINSSSTDTNSPEAIDTSQKSEQSESDSVIGHSDFIESGKRRSMEIVRGEASLLDSADEDSGIESSTNATLERQT